MKTIPVDNWAYAHYVLTKDTIASYLNPTPMHEMVALGHFLTSQKPSLLSIEYKKDPTIIILYSIARDAEECIISKEEKTIDIFFDVCNNTQKQFEKINQAADGLPDSHKKGKIQNYAHDVILYTENYKRKCVANARRC